MTTSGFRRSARGVLATLVVGALAAAIPVAIDAPAAQAARALPGLETAAAAVATPPRYAPSRIPDRITLLPAADPTTAQVISWRTSPEVITPVVEYRTLTATPYPSGVLTQLATTSAVLTTDLGYTQVTHTADLTGLTPGVAYMYRVGDGTNFSEWQDFETSAATADPFSFIFLGDIQVGILSQDSRVLRNAFRDRPNADLVVQVGDMVDDANSDQQWGEIYDAFDYTLGTQTLLTTPGNHEYDGGLSKQWAQQYTYPDNGPKGTGAAYDELDGTVYYTDHEGVRFISLNSNATAEAPLAIQTAWLEQTLKTNPNQWTVVFFHHPVYSLDEGRNNLSVRTSWGPILEKYNVDLVLQGHDHAYGRGNSVASEQNLPAGADPALSHTGPVYIGSSASEKMYDAGPRLWNENGAHLRRLETGKQYYQLIDVRSGTLRYESRTADGEFFDGFTITKSGGTKLVTDGVEPQVIDPTEPAPCLGCEEPGTDEPTGPLTPGTPAGTISYQQTGFLKSVARQSMAALPAGVAYHQSRDTLFLGDQNGRRIFEIDPDTDKVLREMTLPENIRDIGIDEKNQLLYVGQQNRNWVVVSIADADYGQVVRGPYPIIESNRSMDVDAANDFAYAAIPARGVEVFRASTGQSLGVISGTADAYYVAAENGKVAVAYFRELTNVVNVEVFDAKAGFAKLWSIATRPNPRQLDIDTTNGLLYVGYTGTSADRGGYTVHDLTTGKFLADMVGPAYGKDGYGITVDEEHQRVFVANRDFRLNPPGEELVPAAVTVSQRTGLGGGSGPTDPTGPTEPEQPAPPTGTGYTPTSMNALTMGTESDPTRTVGSVVDSRTGNVLVGNEQRPARVWEIDPDTDKVLRTITVPNAATEGVRDVALDEKANELYVAYGASVVVLDATSGAVKRGPFAFSGNVRGMDVDVARGHIVGATRGTGFDVLDLQTGTRQTIAPTLTAWRSHGIAVDGAAGRIYVSNSDTAGATEAVRVYDAATLEPLSSIPYSGSTNIDLRSIAVDPIAHRVYVGHQDDLYDNGGFSVYSTTDRSLIGDFRAYKYGSKVYGVSVDPARGAVYLSGRDGYPTPLTVAQRDKAVVPPAPLSYSAKSLTVLPTANEDARPVGSLVDSRTGHLLVGNEQRPARVWEIDPATDAIVRTIDVPVPTAAADGVRDIALDEAANELYVAYGNKWAVLDATSAVLKRGPFTFSANVRGMDIGGGRVYGGLRGTGFEVMDATTGALIQTIAPALTGWSTHGVAVDRTTGLIYLSNSDNTAATEAVRVYNPTTLELVRSLPASGAVDLRSIFVDGAHGRVYAAHQSDVFDDGGFTVFATADLAQLGTFRAYKYGSKVYGVSVDGSTGAVYLSARDRYPAGIVVATKD